MSVHDVDRLLLEKTEKQIRRFTPENREQQKLRALLLTMLGYMQRVFCRPGQEHHLARWWTIVDRYWRTLESPALLGPQRQALLASLLGDEDEAHDHETAAERDRCQLCRGRDLEAMHLYRPTPERSHDA